MKYWSMLQHVAAAVKSLQSCPTLCDPIDGSPPGSTVPGILQARTLEWVAILNIFLKVGWGWGLNFTQIWEILHRASNDHGCLCWALDEQTSPVLIFLETGITILILIFQKRMDKVWLDKASQTWKLRLKCQFNPKAHALNFIRISLWEASL